MKTRIEFYKRKCEEVNFELAAKKRKATIFLAGKLLSFAAIITLIVLYYDNINITTSSIMVLVVATYLLLMVADEKLKNSIKKLNHIHKLCKDELSYFEGDFSSFDAGDRYIDTYHNFTYDLDIFGKSSLYNRINRTITDKGSDALAHKLQTIPTNTSVVEENKAAIKELATMTEWRIDFLSNKHTNSNFELLDKIAKSSERIAKNILFSKIIYIPLILTFISVILAATSVVTWGVFVVMVLVQLTIAISMSKLVTEISSNADSVSKEYKGYLALLSIIDKADFKASKLQNIHRSLLGSQLSCVESFKKISKILGMLDQRNNVLIYVVLNGVLMYDILLVRSFIQWEKKYMSCMKGWIEQIGEVDALTSLATYCYNTPQNSWGVVDCGGGFGGGGIDDGCKIIDTTDLYHPFLQYDKAVANSFKLDTNNIGIITGANMAGKSTFLRSLGVNYILAANGAPVCAKEFKFSLVSLFSSMRTSDDLSNNISYFHAELRRLKQLIKHCSTHPFTFIILDEILKGTNSVDKLKGSIIYLETLAKYPVSGVIATHDLELAKLEDTDGKLYNNYCFEIELTEEIEYNYKISRGVAQNLNATYLLGKMLREI